MISSVSDKLTEGDITGAVRLLALSSEISPENDETLTALGQKHFLLLKTPQCLQGWWMNASLT